jgi:uncharacterized RDD family membrane protein YckC
LPATICPNCQRRGTVVAYLAKLPLRCVACGHGLKVLTEEQEALAPPAEAVVATAAEVPALAPAAAPEVHLADPSANGEAAADTARVAEPTISIAFDPELPPLFPIGPPPEPITAETRLKPIDDTMPRAQLSDLLKEIVSLPPTAAVPASAATRPPAPPPLPAPPVKPEVEAASKGRRLLARLLLAAFVVALVLFAPAWQAAVTRLGLLPRAWPTFAKAAVGFVPLLLFALLNLLLIALRGQDFGKLFLGIKVVREDGSKAGVGTAFFRREFVLGVFAAAILVPGQLLATMLATQLVFLPFAVVAALILLVDAAYIFMDGDQCLHDRLAKTKVVRV